MKIHFITYGTHTFKDTINRLLTQAVKFNVFNTIKAYGPDDLPDSFKQSHQSLLSMKRGGGYWLWRAIILKQAFDIINENDILVFLDAGCSINMNGKKTFFEYIQKLNNSPYGVLSFKINYTERVWTIKEIFDYYDIDINSAHALSDQYCAGCIILRKNDHSRKFLEEFVSVTLSKPELFTDIYNSGQIKSFIENRHDQSISSIIRKKIGSVVINESPDVFLNYIPFWATRIRNYKPPLKSNKKKILFL
jgi:hypothetical protein